MKIIFLNNCNTFIIIDWERPKPNSSTGPPMTRKSSSASSPRDSGTPRNQNNREMTTVSVVYNLPNFDIALLTLKKLDHLNKP